MNMQGMVSLISSDGVQELNILISILAVFHILYCTLTMCLGKAKVYILLIIFNLVETKIKKLMVHIKLFSYPNQFFSYSIVMLLSKKIVMLT
jgi:hypothetical protein